MTSKKASTTGESATANANATADQLSDWAESEDFTIAPTAVITKSTRSGAGQALLEAALGSSAAVDRALGRPSLGGAGTSPSRTLRLPRELDEALIARAAAEHRKPSEIVREALSNYLGKAS